MVVVVVVVGMSAAMMVALVLKPAVNVFIIFVLATIGIRKPNSSAKISAPLFSTHYAQTLSDRLWVLRQVGAQVKAKCTHSWLFAAFADRLKGLCDEKTMPANLY